MNTKSPTLIANRSSSKVSVLDEALSVVDNFKASKPRRKIRKSTETLAVNVTGKVRRETLQGREYLVAPVRMIVEGVLNGSKGALFYPRQEYARDPSVWNGMPLVRNHPTDERGNHVSARSADILEKFGLGMVLSANTESGNLDAEAWFDVEQTRRVDNELYQRIASGKPIELSTGLFTDNYPAPRGAVHNGRAYQFIARNYRPDHLAILPDQKGACSLQDGCGVLVNKKQEDCDCGGACDECKKEKETESMPPTGNSLWKALSSLFKAVDAAANPTNNASVGQIKDAETGKWLPNGAGTGKGPIHKAAAAGYRDEFGIDEEDGSGVEGLEAEDGDMTTVTNGGPGSGNFGHAGCPGSVGGSCGTGGKSTQSKSTRHEVASAKSVELAKSAYKLAKAHSKTGFLEAKSYLARRLSQRADKLTKSGKFDLAYRIHNAAAKMHFEAHVMTSGDGRRVHLHSNNVKAWKNLAVSKAHLEASKAHQKAASLVQKKITVNHEDEAMLTNGGPGSGNFGHAGCPGQVGGSCGTGGGSGGKGESYSKDPQFQALKDIYSKAGETSDGEISSKDFKKAQPIIKSLTEKYGVDQGTLLEHATRIEEPKESSSKPSGKADKVTGILKPSSKEVVKITGGVAKSSKTVKTDTKVRGLPQKDGSSSPSAKIETTSVFHEIKHSDPFTAAHKLAEHLSKDNGVVYSVKTVGLNKARVSIRDSDTGESNHYTFTSNQEDHTGSSVTNVDVLTVLDHLEGEPDMALTSNDRKKLIAGLTANCECQEANVFNEEDAEMLEGLTDNQLVGLVKQKKAIITANEMPPALKAAADKKKAAAEESDDEEEMTENRLTPEEQEDLAYARRAKQARKEQVINQLVANVSDDAAKKAKVAKLNQRTLNELEELLDLMPAPTNNATQTSYSPVLYFGAAPVVNNNKAPTYNQDDALPIPTMNWEEEAKLNK